MSKILRNKNILNKELNLSVDCFSGGEIQRLGLIRTWLRDKPIELLDEPTSMLDKELRESPSLNLLSTKFTDFEYLKSSYFLKVNWIIVQINPTMLYVNKSKIFY